MSDEAVEGKISGVDLLQWFRETTEEIDSTPARLRHLATRRRQLARDLVEVYGHDEAAALVGISELTLASLVVAP